LYPFALLAPDKKMRQTNCANTEGLFRIILNAKDHAVQPVKSMLFIKTPKGVSKVRLALNFVSVEVALAVARHVQVQGNRTAIPRSRIRSLACCTMYSPTY